MKRFKVLGLVLMVTFVVGVVVAATAGALPLMLPEGGTKTTSLASVGEVTFETTAGRRLICKSVTGESEETAQALGPFHIRFKECRELEFKTNCTGLGDATGGEILELGTYHLVYDEVSTTLGVAILFLLSPVHFSCASGIVLIKIEGSELCLILEPYVLKTLHEFHCVQTRGVGNHEGYFNDNGTQVKAGTTNSENERTSVGLALLALGLVLWLLNNRNVDVLIMMS